ncbi:MAG: cbb3-type cytochrome c oxidase subunit I [Alphaproteobacteria bacterium]|nr:cbb3-type cytochrome c oxidase subunit I [Alphaproteobacteria bacterium]
MNGTIAWLFAVTFVIGAVGLLGLVAAIARRQFGAGGAHVPFLDHEEGWAEDPVATPRLQRVLGATPRSPDPAELRDRDACDRSSRGPVLAFVLSAVAWLAVGSIFGLVVSLKFQYPDWLTDQAWTTFGRLRPLHLDTVAYGWLSMAGMGVALWLLPRLLRTPLRGGRWATAGALFWNIGMLLGTGALASGWTDGLEWLEYPWQIDGFFVIGGSLAAVPMFLTLPHRKVDHLYVSALYIIGALVWFPILFVVANIPNLHFGVEHALVNWWFAHNVLGLWFTPLGLAAAYYLIPKIVGRPIYSYQLSLLGFWSLALFYSQVGVHHLIGGPVPGWVVTLSIVTSVSMVIPVFAVAVNHHLTVLGRFRALRHSPVLRFIVLGAMLYTAASFQGSMESLRSVNTLTHFTHYTVAHAHLGAYGFASIVFFGAIYFLMPRVTGVEWPWRPLVDVHFALIAVGFFVYFTTLTIGGLLQGQAMLDASRPFTDSVSAAAPWLWGRTAGGLLMTLGHLVFAVHVGALALRAARAPALSLTEEMT